MMRSMMKLCVILVLSVILTLTSSEHIFSKLNLCSDTVDAPEFLLDLDQNELMYENFKTHEQVMRIPSFVQAVNIPDLSQAASTDNTRCLQYIQETKAFVGSPPEARDPPEIVIYPKHNMVPGVENHFVCFITNFYPPKININWTRNGVSVTEGVYISQFSLNSDGSFNVFSTLTSSPNEGDEYSCTVEHEALDSPQTRTWDEPVVTSSVTPTVVLGVGIAVGILGLATGMFFVIKALLPDKLQLPC
ncbi:H-2 class II histocompatibility antigen, A-Q alpha chain-like [Clarias gariepinus]